MTSAGTVPITLMHGAFNAFAVLDERTARFQDDVYPDFARSASAQFDVDGLLVVRAPEGYDAEMRIFNRDGSESEMCGNGLRCVVRYLTDRAGFEPVSVLTKHGAVATHVVSREPFAVRVEIGPIDFPFGPRPLEFADDGVQHEFIAVSAGNPHAVVFVETVDGLDMALLARAFVNDPRFPSGVNVHAAEPLHDRSMRVKHFERGAGETKACGSGAVACAVAAIATRGAIAPVTVRTPGGALTVSWRPGEFASLEGPAEFIGDRILRE